MRLPDIFVQSLKSVNGFHQKDFCACHEQEATVTAVRYNPFKKRVLWNDTNSSVVPWCSHGRYLFDRISFTLDPYFHAGAYYVQEASSMFVEHVFNTLTFEHSPKKVLDLCAAPGGKSTLLLSLIDEQDILVCNEVIKTRVPVLTDNVNKWGKQQVVITHNDAKDFQRLPAYFDCVLVDAPCSGSGMFRKDERAIAEWSLEHVKLCSQRQQRIVADILPALKSGGYLLYSTCSYSVEENEQQLDWLLQHFNLETIRIPLGDWGIVETQSSEQGAWGYRFYPDKIRGEGFFMACLRKTDGVTDAVKYSSQKLVTLPKNDNTVLQHWLNDIEQLFICEVGDYVYAMPNALRREVEILTKNLYVKKAGVCVGKMMRAELLPEHQLALSTLLSGEVARVALDQQQALAYLRKDAQLQLNNSQQGWALATYDGLGLGWMKVLPNRINNYFPKELRVLR